jgi:hypothetical protein
MPKKRARAPADPANLDEAPGRQHNTVRNLGPGAFDRVIGEFLAELPEQERSEMLSDPDIAEFFTRYADDAASETDEGQEEETSP